MSRLALPLACLLAAPCLAQGKVRSAAPAKRLPSRVILIDKDLTNKPPQLKVLPLAPKYRP